MRRICILSLVHFLSHFALGVTGTEETLILCVDGKRRVVRGVAGFVTRLYSALSVFAVCSTVVPQQAGSLSMQVSGICLPFPLMGSFRHIRGKL